MMESPGPDTADRQAAFVALLRRGSALLADGDTGGARAAFEHAVEIAPGAPGAHVRLGDVLAFLGDLDGAAWRFRHAIELAPDCGPAWWGLAALKTEAFSDAETTRLESLWRNDQLLAANRIPIGFALAAALDRAGRHADAFAALREANSSVRARNGWDAGDFQRRIEHMLAAFSPMHERAPASNLGAEVIFIVGLPRSGSTLIEQILAAHSEVEGASELGDLGAVIGEESQRRRRSFPDWVGDANSDDWQRMGERYLERTARWRQRVPRCTDKMPGNWLYLGAAARMLPGAHFINSRRDPLETCFSCYRHLFSSGAVFAYDFDDLAAYWHAYAATMKHWDTLFPGRIRSQRLETLQADPEWQIRDLLSACELGFEPACLEFHAARRSVRTASAAQVRQPLSRNTARADRYGALLDPLRQALARTGSR